MSQPRSASGGSRGLAISSGRARATGLRKESERRAPGRRADRLRGLRRRPARGSRPTGAPQRRIEAVARQKLAVRADLGDLAPVEHDQAVHRRDRRQPMRDRDDGLALHQRVEVLLDRRLDLGVERRGRLVEDQDRRVLQQDARDRDALPLSAGQLHAALADMGVVARAPVRIGEAEHEIVRMRLLARRRSPPPIGAPAGRSGCCRRWSGAAARCPA